MEVKKNNTTIAVFDYDGDGQRVIATNGTTTTGFVGDHTEWKVGAASQPTRYYNASGMRLATRLDGVMYYPLTDHLGSTTMTTDASGNEYAEIRYKAWGESRYTYGTLPTKHQYTGQYTDSYINLIWYGSRWYDPSVGRFVSADSIVPDRGNPQGLDRYSYVANNPISRTDESGHCWGIASFIRGMPSYKTTCQNLDLALIIIQSNETSLSNKAIAGGYIASEGLAHGALAAGGALLACSTNVSCVAAAESLLHIGAKVCSDGDCTNESRTFDQAIQSVWQMNPFRRRVAIENMLGRSPQLAQNFPVIDRWQNGIATSIKSIDLMAKSYQNINTLTRTVQGYINTLANWQGATWGNITIQANQIVGRELILAIPPNASAAQIQALQQLQQSALNQGINLMLTTIR